jgi:hypothetical protein
MGASAVLDQCGRSVAPAGEENTVDLSAATDRSGEEPTPQMPSVADYWPDRPGATATDRPQPEEPQHPAEPAEGAADRPRHATEPSPPADDGGIPWIASPAAPSPRRVRLTRGGAVALALLVVTVGVLTTLIKQAHSRPVSSAAPATSPQAAAALPVPAETVTVAPVPATKPSPPLPPVVPPAHGATNQAPKRPATATFEVAATAGSVTVRSQDLGSDLYRVTLAKRDAKVAAKVTDTGANHRLTLVKDAGTTAPPVTITLNAGVRWSLKLTAGNSETTVNLTQSKLASLDLAGGAHVFDLALPPVTGTLPLRVTHGMNQLKIKTNGDPVRVTLDAGAGTVVIDGETHTGVKRGTVLTSDGWAAAADRVDVDSVEGVGTLTVDTD